VSRVVVDSFFSELEKIAAALWQKGGHESLEAFQKFLAETAKARQAFRATGDAPIVGSPRTGRGAEILEQLRQQRLAAAAAGGGPQTRRVAAQTPVQTHAQIIEHPQHGVKWQVDPKTGKKTPVAEAGYLQSYGADPAKAFGEALRETVAMQPAPTTATLAQRPSALRSMRDELAAILGRVTSPFQTSR
jgi:hypothetical protein